MTKSDWITQVADQLGAPKQMTERTIDTAIAEIRHALARGDRISVPGLGSFVVSDQQARRVRNPKTGVMIDVPRKKRVTYRAAEALKAAIQPPAKPKRAPKRTPTPAPKKTGVKVTKGKGKKGN